MAVPWVTRRLVAWTLLAILMIVFLYYLVTFVQVWRAAEADDRRPSEAIIILGAAQFDGRPSAVYRARLDHALALYNDDVAPTIVVTGGKQEGDRFTEADAGRNYLIRAGIPDGDILSENTSHSSFESLAASARFLLDDGIKRVVLVSDPFHSLRIKLIAEELGFDAVTSPTRTSPISGLDVVWRYAAEALRVAFGRIFGFGNLARASRVGKVVPGIAILGAPSGVV